MPLEGLPKLCGRVPPDAAGLHCSVKRDGHLLEISKDSVGLVTLRTKLPTDVTDKLRWHRESYQVAVLYMPCDSRVVGELWVEGRPSSAVKTAINERSGDLRFEAFAVLERQGGPCRPDGDPSMHETALSAWGFAVPPSTQWPMSIEAIRPGYCEGAVLKRHALSGWYKWKPEPTADLVVTDFKDGKGKYLGLIGALVCSAYDPSSDQFQEVCRCSGMTDEVRLEMSRGGWQRHLGKVVEVRYQYVASKGRLRHPRFLRERDDKLPRECTLDQLVGEGEDG